MDQGLVGDLAGAQAGKSTFGSYAMPFTWRLMLSQNQHSPSTNLNS
jgi:hypothetical protein